MVWTLLTESEWLPEPSAEVESKTVTPSDCSTADEIVTPLI